MCKTEGITPGSQAWWVPYLRVTGALRTDPSASSKGFIFSEFKFIFSQLPKGLASSSLDTSMPQFLAVRGLFLFPLQIIQHDT